MHETLVVDLGVMLMVMVLILAAALHCIAVRTLLNSTAADTIILWLPFNLHIVMMVLVTVASSLPLRVQNLWHYFLPIIIGIGIGGCDGFVLESLIRFIRIGLFKCRSVAQITARQVCRFTFGGSSLIFLCFSIVLSSNHLNILLLLLLLLLMRVFLLLSLNPTAISIFPEIFQVGRWGRRMILSVSR